MNHNRIDPGKIELLRAFAGTASGDGAIRIDDLNVAHSAPGFMKIDVDGFELDVLLGGKNLLAHGDTDLLVETHSAALEAQCAEYLKQFGYACRVSKNAWWRVLIPEQRPLNHNPWLFAEKR
jgi:hypothetical protein